MYLITISFFLGTLTLQLFEKPPNLHLIIILSVILLLFVILVIFCKIFNSLTQGIVFFLVGFIWATLNALSTLSWSLEKDMENQPLIVKGRIASLPQLKKIDQYGKTETVENFVFDTITIGNQNKKTKLNINWYDPQIVKYGEVWQLEVRLKRPHGNSNPGSFDFEKYLFQNRIRAVGYVIPGKNNIFLQTSNLWHCLGNYRQKLRDQFLIMFAEAKMEGIIIALILGDQSKITKSQWTIFRDTGTSYLMAISGLHIGLAALMFYYLVALIWKLYARLTLLIPLKHIGTITGLAAASVYSALSGFSIPTQRALIMLLFCTIMFMLSREIKASKTLFLALFLVLSIEPQASLFVGFWLSFAAVAFIIYVTQGRKNMHQSWWRKYWRMQIAVTLGILPFSLLIFNQVSFVSMIANLFALPLVCSIVVPMSLLGFITLPIFTSLSYYILLAAEKIMELLWLPLQWMSSLHFLNWYNSIFNFWIFLASILGAILILAPKGFPSKWLGIVFFLPLIFTKQPLPKSGEVWLYVLDVGQGLATVIQTSKHVLIYDSGPKFAEGDAGETVIVPFLRHLGISAVDTMIISHGDDDHIGGANSIISSYQINKIYTSVPDKFSQKNVQLCNDSQSWNWDGVNFQFIYPTTKNAVLISDNDNSCVLRVNNGLNVVLLPGDIEKKTEKWLVDNKSVNLPATILVAPHHGSASSSSDDFINAVSPRYVLFSTGYLNRFHFPAQSVIDRYFKYKVAAFNTANTGAIFFKFDDKNDIQSPLLYRGVNKHYWNE